MPPPILVGPRVFEGEAGYQVILPFLRSPNDAPLSSSNDDRSTPSSSSSGWFSSWWSSSPSSTDASPTAPSPPAPRPILVNLGFVPSSLITPHNLSSLVLPSGHVQLEGMLRNKGLGKLASAKEGKPGYFTPENDPRKRNWYWVDTDLMASYFENEKSWGKVEPVMVDVIYGACRPFSFSFYLWPSL